MIGNVRNLLAKADLVRTKYDYKREAQEEFNIFSVLHKETDERRLHSRFIAALLNPQASHKKKYTLLTEFLNLFPDLAEADFENAVVFPEEWNKKEHENIDILVLDKNTKRAIIIENKIGAGDSNNEKGGQLERYYNYVKDELYIPKERITVFYLSLDGHEPSVDSLGAYKTLESINGRCISYEQEILTWLENCLTRVIDKPFLRESVLQYQKLIQKMTNMNTEVDERTELKDLIGKSLDNTAAAKHLFDNYKHIKWHTLDDFWKEITNEVERRGYKIIRPYTEDGYEFITAIAHKTFNNSGESGGIDFEVKAGLPVSIWNEAKDPLCIRINKGGLASKYAEQLAAENQKTGLKNSEKIWKMNFESATNEGRDIYLKNFESEMTFNLIRPEFRAVIISEIFAEIDRFVGLLEG